MLFDSLVLSFLSVNEAAALLWLISPLIPLILYGIKESSLLYYAEIGYELAYLISSYILVYVFIYNA